MRWQNRLSTDPERQVGRNRGRSGMRRPPIYRNTTQDQRVHLTCSIVIGRIHQPRVLRVAEARWDPALKSVRLDHVLSLAHLVVDPGARRKLDLEFRIVHSPGQFTRDDLRIDHSHDFAVVAKKYVPPFFRCPNLAGQLVNSRDRQVSADMPVRIDRLREREISSVRNDRQLRGDAVGTPNEDDAAGSTEQDRRSRFN
jgi:hypothetical protein